MQRPGDCLLPPLPKRLARVMAGLHMGDKGTAPLLTLDPEGQDIGRVNRMRRFTQSGIAITAQIPPRVGRQAHNRDDLAVKALKSGHQP